MPLRSHKNNKIHFKMNLKNSIVFGARDFIGREFFDIQKEGIVTQILFIEDFEYRLNKDRFRF